MLRDCRRNQEITMRSSHPRGTRMDLLNELRSAVEVEESEIPYLSKDTMQKLARAMNIPEEDTMSTFFRRVPGWTEQRHTHSAPTAENLVALLDRLTDPDAPIVVKAEAEPPVRKTVGRPKGAKAIKPPTVEIPTTAIMRSVLAAIPEQVVVESIAIEQSGKEATIKIVFK